MNAPAEFDQFAENYDERLNQALTASGETKDFFARGRVEWLAQSLLGIRASVRSAIDYGCGVGGTTVLLRDLLGCESVVGLDVSERLLERAKREYGSATCRFMTFPEYRPDGAVDVVYCNGVFHHIPPVERTSAVDYVLRCLRPGGVFALWENNPWNPGTQYVMHRCDFDRDAVKISPWQAVSLLRSSGFEILRTDYRFFFPRALCFLRPLEAALAKVPLGGQYQVLARKRQRVNAR
jgi:SAM-dependent methyltransferase